MFLKLCSMYSPEEQTLSGSSSRFKRNVSMSAWGLDRTSRVNGSMGKRPTQVKSLGKMSNVTWKTWLYCKSPCARIPLSSYHLGIPLLRAVSGKLDPSRWLEAGVSMPDFDWEFNRRRSEQCNLGWRDMPKCGFWLYLFMQGTAFLVAWHTRDCLPVRQWAIQGTSRKLPHFVQLLSLD